MITRLPPANRRGCATAGVLLAVSLLLPTRGGAQQLQPTAATRDRHAAIDSIFSSMDGTRSPGCAVAVSNDGRVDFRRGYGMANLDWGIPIGSNSVFYMASVSKQFTAAAVALASLEGLLDLDAPIRSYIPELPEYAGPPLTVRHLVHHTGGVRDYLGLRPTAGIPQQNVISDQGFLELISAQRALDFEPGSRYAYSNSGYVLLSLIVKRATGRTLGEYARQRIFEPLGMTSTHFHEDAARIVPNRVTGYGSARDGGYEMNHFWHFDRVGDGGLYSTVEDMLKWNANFDDPVVGGPELLRLILTPGRLSDGTQLDYAFGLAIGEHRGLPTISHGGALMGFRTQFVRFPEQEVAVAVNCNHPARNPGERALRVADLYLEGDLAEESVTASGSPQTVVSLPAERIQALAGEYRAPDAPRYLSFRASEGALLGGWSGTIRYVPVGQDRFQQEGRATSPLYVFATEGENGSYVDVITPTEQTIRFQRVEPATPTTQELEVYTGRYSSPELPGSDFRIELRDGTLTLQRGTTEDPVSLSPLAKGEFRGGSSILSFQQEGGRVMGFLLNAEGFVFQRTEP